MGTADREHEPMLTRAKRLAHPQLPSEFKELERIGVSHSELSILGSIRHADDEEIAALFKQLREK